MNEKISEYTKVLSDTLLKKLEEEGQEGVLRLYFSNIGRTVLNWGNSENISVEALEEIREIITIDDFIKIREEMADPDKGAWLHCVLTVNTLTQSTNWDFNYDQRHNILQPRWVLTVIDPHNIEPTRDQLLEDLKKYPRTQSNIPDWYEKLINEKDALYTLTENISNKDFFKDALVSPTLPKTDFFPEEVREFYMTQNIWDIVSDEYEKFLIKDEDVLMTFVDNTINPLIEFSNYSEEKIAFNSAARIVKEFGINERAQFMNRIYISEENEDWLYDLDDEIDSQELDDDVFGIVSEYIKIQTSLRFKHLKSDYGDCSHLHNYSDEVLRYLTNV